MSLLENNREKAALLFSAFILVIITLVSGGMAIYVVSDPGISNAVTLTRAAYKIRDNYPEEYDFSRLIDNARRGMLSQFDRYTGYLEKSQFENLDEEFTGEYSGIGVSVVKDDDGLMIMSIRENGPSGNIGLLTGDVIIVVDSQSIESASVIQSTKLLRGKAGTEVAITVHRKFSFDTLHFTITRGKIPLLHIPFAGYRADSILYIRLLDFEMGASSDLNAALDSLLSEADRKNAKGLILDLRGNPGGLFSEAYRVSDIFLEKGISIVGTSGRSRWDSERFYSESPDKTRGLPMAILVDNGSASSAEITAGALKEAGRAILIGDTTFGKGLVQGFIRFQDGDGLRLTISRYFVGDSLYLNRIDSDLNESGDGLIPDFYFEQETKSNLLMSLDNSLLLNRFVYENKIEIIAAIENNNLNDALKFKKEDVNVIEEKILKIIKEKPGLSSNAYMGLVMKEFGGKVSGKEVMEIIKKYVK